MSAPRTKTHTVLKKLETLNSNIKLRLRKIWQRGLQIAINKYRQGSSLDNATHNAVLNDLTVLMYISGWPLNHDRDCKWLSNKTIKSIYLDAVPQVLFGRNGQHFFTLLFLPLCLRTNWLMNSASRCLVESSAPWRYFVLFVFRRSKCLRFSWFSRQFHPQYRTWAHASVISWNGLLVLLETSKDSCCSYRR